MRLIDDDALLSCIGDMYHSMENVHDTLSHDYERRMAKAQLGAVLDVVREIHEAPTIEAEPVRHGRWEWYEEWGPSTWLEPPDIINAGWKCTECGIDLGEYLTAKLHEEVYVGDMDKMPEVDRCPNCGAKMDAKEENT